MAIPEPCHPPPLLTVARTPPSPHPRPNPAPPSSRPARPLLRSNVFNFPRALNVFIASDSTAGVGVSLGYGFVPGSDSKASSGHIFMT